jgi:hypothetical protein
MENMPATVLNELFISKADDASGEKEKLAAAGSAYVRDKLREMSFCRKIIPPQPVTVAECQRSLYHDTVYKIVDIEPGSRAMSISFRGEPDPKLIKGRRMAVAFFTVSSLKWEGYTEELRTYTYPISDVIKNNIVKDIQEIEDRYFLVHVMSCIEARQALANGDDPAVPGGWTNNGSLAVVAGTVVQDATFKSELATVSILGDASVVVNPIQKTDIAYLAKLFTLGGRALRMSKVLMTEYTFADFGQLTAADLGHVLTKDVMVKGYKYNTVLGYNIMTTLKGNLLHDGFVYGFTDPAFFGKSYILDNIKFYVKKEARSISFWAWENIGMGLANIAAVNRLELISGDSMTDATTRAAVNPAAETSLGAVNNQVADGYTYPGLWTY